MTSFAWSFSKLKNFETCPKKHYEIDIAKHYADSTEQLEWGNKVHGALARAVTGKAPLPKEMKDYQKWVNSLRRWKGEMLVEQKFALAKDFTPCEWFGPRVWLRVIGDVVGIAPPNALILDWKTGKPLVDSKQLMLLAQCVFAFHPDVNFVDSGFVWLQHDAQSIEHYERDTIRNEWIGLLPRVDRLQKAAETMDYPPTPNKLCARYCPVTACPFHGKRP